ncbi:hypothetical protein [Streptomyces sp. B1I3]|uniref:hypothetical protein n=1 Tax=Streptomyces sp. B1I3 TaxID=3042264 RepID=UPI0027859A09|nr:hypothetical protein [Streptomyces sp. B1I3]MDQ0793420.1 hypothetical protein [Streptomyces sp. B1I3]
MRVRRGSIRLAAWVMAATVPLTACSHLLRDLGPLPARSSAPPAPADTVVAELTSAMAAEGVQLRRTPPELLPLECQESLAGEYPSPATVDAALKSGFARARSEHGWDSGPDLGSGWLSLRKADWIAAATLPGAGAAGTPTAPVVITLQCDSARVKPAQPAASPVPTPSTP